jgi:hypothetical protein
VIENNGCENAGKSASALNGHPSTQLQGSHRIPRKESPEMAADLDTIGTSTRQPTIGPIKVLAISSANAAMQNYVVKPCCNYSH